MTPRLQTCALTLLVLCAQTPTSAKAEPDALSTAESCMARGDFACAETAFLVLYHDPAYAPDRWALVGNIALCIDKQGETRRALDWLARHLPDAPDAPAAAIRRLIGEFADKRLSAAERAYDPNLSSAAETTTRHLLGLPISRALRQRAQLLLARSLIDQARCSEARPVLEEIVPGPDTPRESIEALAGRCVGTLVLDCHPSTDSVTLEIGQTFDGPRSCPTTFIGVEPGPAVIVATFTDRPEPIRLTTEVVGGQKTLITVEPPPEEPFPWGPLGLATAGTTSLIAGVGFYAANQSKVDELRGDPSNRNLRDSVDRWYGLSIAGYAVGAAALLGAGVWWTLDRPAPLTLDGNAEPDPEVQVRIGLDGITLLY